MGFFSRLALFFRIRSHAALDNAENPGQVLDYSYSKQLEQLQQMKQAIAEVITAEKRLEIQQTQAIDKMNLREQQARQALVMGRGDLARMALEEKEQLVGQVNSFEKQLSNLRAQKEQLLQTQRTLAQRVETFRTQKEMVKAQYSAAKAQVRVNETLTGLSDEMSEVQAAMHRAQDKMLDMQARANAMQTIVEADDISGLLPASPLDREMQKLTAEQNIEDQLQAMQDELRLSGPAFGQKQIEGPTP